jgi:hypothetical protein
LFHAYALYRWHIEEMELYIDAAVCIRVWSYPVDICKWHLVKAKAKLSLNTPWSCIEQVKVQLHLFLTSGLDIGGCWRRVSFVKARLKIQVFGMLPRGYC